jgi:hypothetical protein
MVLQQGDPSKAFPESVEGRRIWLIEDWMHEEDIRCDRY